MRENSDGSRFMFLHTESGDVYRLTGPVEIEGIPTYFPKADNRGREGGEVYCFQQRAADGGHQYVMVGKDGKKTYFANDGRILGIVDRYGNTITSEYTILSYQSARMR